MKRFNTLEEAWQDLRTTIYANLSDEMAEKLKMVFVAGATTAHDLFVRATMGDKDSGPIRFRDLSVELTQLVSKYMMKQ